MLNDRTLTVLTIDDNPDIREMVNHILCEEGYHTLEASNGREGLSLLQTLEDFELPDLILLDYNMPDLNGEEFHRELSKDLRFLRIPVVLMTGNPNLREIMDHLNVEAYISKPMNIDSILKVARNFTERREAARYSFLA